MKGLSKSVSSELFRRYNINFDFENTLSDFDKLITGAEKIVKAKWKIRDFTRANLPSDRINELVNKFDSSYRVKKRDEKSFGKVGSRNDGMEKLTNRFSKLIINHFTKVLNQNGQLNLPILIVVNSPYNLRAEIISLADLIYFFCGEKGYSRNYY